MNATCTVAAVPGLDGHRDEQGPHARFGSGEVGR